MDKLHLNWDETADLSLRLAEAIKNSGRKFDAIIVVPRGGYFVANIVARELGFGVNKLFHACVGSYEDGQNNKGSLAIGEMPSAEDIGGKKLLIIDEVCDTGDTLDYLVKYLQDNGAEMISSGVLHYKPANTTTGYQPDYYIDQTDQWIVYPWETKEFANI